MINFKKYLKEVVSQDCSTGSGVIPDGPYQSWVVIRTNHLDSPRPPSERPRDYGWECDDFEDVVTAFLKKRPMGIKDGKYLIEWKNKKGYQCLVMNIDNKRKEMTVITMIQLNKKSSGGYNASGAKFIGIGNINIPD